MLAQALWKGKHFLRVSIFDFTASYLGDLPAHKSTKARPFVLITVRIFSCEFSLAGMLPMNLTKSNFHPNLLYQSGGYSSHFPPLES